MARASLDDEDAWEDDFQTPHTPVCRVVWREGEPAAGRMEASRGSPGWHPCYQVDIGEEEVMLESIDLTWRATHWLQLAVQSIADDEVPLYELVIPLTSGNASPHDMESQGLRGGHLFAHPTTLNIGQFMTADEVAEGIGETHWFVAYSCTLQWVGEAACRWEWEWPAGEALEVKVSPLVHAFWEETGTDLTMACVKLCWEPAPRAIFCKREEGPVAHIITFLDELAVWAPSLDAWDQFVWPPATAIPRALTEAELYGYCHGQSVDLGPVMPAAQFRVMDEVGTYLCMVRALVFKGSILAYNPTKNEAEWVPAHDLANDLTWAKERSAVALANYVPCIPEEVAQITRLGAHQLVSWPTDSPTSEEEEEEEWDPELPTMDTELERGEESEDGARQMDLEEEWEPDRWQHSWDWEAVMGETERLAYDDPQSESDATVMGVDGHSPRCLTPHVPGSPMEAAVEVHVRESKLEDL